MSRRNIEKLVQEFDKMNQGSHSFIDSLTMQDTENVVRYAEEAAGHERGHYEVKCSPVFLAYIGIKFGYVCAMKRMKANRKKEKAEYDEKKTFLREQERHIVMDFVTIALGRMGFHYTKFQEFRETLAQVYQDYANLIMEVKQDDPKLLEVFANIDREILLYCGQELFEPYEQRHGMVTDQENNQNVVDYQAEREKLIEEYKDLPAQDFKVALKELIKKYNL